MLHKCHTYPTFGSNFAFPAQMDRRGPIRASFGPLRAGKRGVQPTCRHPHATVRMPPSAWNPHAATRTAACGFHAGFIRISCRFHAVSCEIHAGFIQVPACGFGFSDVVERVMTSDDQGALPTDLFHPCTAPIEMPLSQLHATVENCRPSCGYCRRRTGSLPLTAS
jgi:hypothetical protein